MGEANSASTGGTDAVGDFESCATSIEHGAASLTRRLAPSAGDTALAAKQLISYLDVHSKRPPWRWFVVVQKHVRTLGGGGSSVFREFAAARSLVQGLDSADLELRSSAAGALGPLGAKASIGKLRQLMSSGTQPVDVTVHAAFSLALLQPDGPARAWLEDVKKRSGYHAPTLQELLDRIDKGR